MRKGDVIPDPISDWLSQHKYVVLGIVLFIGIFMTPIDEILIIGGFAMFGIAGVVGAIVLMIFLFYFSKKTKTGQKYWGKVYGKLQPYLEH